MRSADVGATEERNKCERGATGEGQVLGSRSKQFSEICSKRNPIRIIVRELNCNDTNRRPLLSCRRAPRDRSDQRKRSCSSKRPQRSEIITDVSDSGTKRKPQSFIWVKTHFPYSQERARYQGMTSKSVQSRTLCRSTP
jgi:hypothetical protein